MIHIHFYFWIPDHDAGMEPVAGLRSVRDPLFEDAGAFAAELVLFCEMRPSCRAREERL